MTTRDYDDEFAAIAADDALLDALGDSRFVEGDDDIAELLSSWRRELDDAFDTFASTTDTLPLAALTTRSGRRLHKHTAGIAAAALVVLAGSAGVAAAASGPHGALGAVNRVLFGTPAHDDSVRLALVRSMLDRAQQGIDHARSHGGATAARLADLGDQLDAAGRVLAADPAAPAGLSSRLAGLRAELAALAVLPTRPPLINTGQSIRGVHPAPAATAPSSGDDRSGPDGDDTRTGSDDGSGDRSGSDDGTTTGSGDSGSGSGSGSDDGTSGGDGGTSGGDGGTSGSDGGTSSGDGGTSGDSGTGSDGGSGTSGSDGGSSGSGSGTSGGDGGTSGPGTAPSDGD